MILLFHIDIHIQFIGLEVSRLGLGCMGMTAFYGGASYKRKENEDKNIEVIGKALELGKNNHHYQ